MRSLGFDFIGSGNRMRAGFEWFHHESSDLIYGVTMPSPPNPARFGYVNFEGITNRGVEVSLWYDVVQGKILSYSTGLNFSTLSTAYNSLTNQYFSLDGTRTGYPGAGPCGCSIAYFRINEGAPVGQFYGPEFRGIDENGEWILSSDADGNPQEMVIGNGFPSSFMGSHKLRYRNWEMNLFFQGVFRHDLISETRLAFESQILTAYNTLTSSRPDLSSYNTWNSFYVENGNYFKLDNLTVSYTIPPTGIGFLKGARIYAGVNNLFVFTNYSGSDPEVRLNDERQPGRLGGAMFPGIDRPSTWLDSRAIVTRMSFRF